MNRLLPTLGLASALLAAWSPAQDRAVQSHALKFTRDTWASCAQCHAAPDPRVPHDARWIGLNETTACLTDKAATPANRKRLIEYLKRGDAPLPALVTAGKSTADAAAPGQGYVTLPATAGSAFLRREGTGGHSTVRLLWKKTPDGSRLALPAGDYNLIGYCFYREDKAGPWAASATVQEGQAPDKIVVGSGGPVALPIHEAIYHDLSATADGPELSVSFQMRNEAGDRMTLTPRRQTRRTHLVRYGRRRPRGCLRRLRTHLRRVQEHLEFQGQGRRGHGRRDSFGHGPIRPVGPRRRGEAQGQELLVPPPLLRLKGGGRRERPQPAFVSALRRLPLASPER